MVPGFLYPEEPNQQRPVRSLPLPHRVFALLSGDGARRGGQRSVEMRRDIPNSIEMSAKITAEAMAVSLATFASVMSAVGILGTR